MARKEQTRHIYKPNIYYWNLNDGARRISGHYVEYPNNITRVRSVWIEPGGDMIAALNDMEEYLRFARAEQHRKRRQDENVRQELIVKAMMDEAEREAQRRRQAMEESVARNSARARKDVDIVRRRYGMADRVVYLNVYGEGVMA